VTTAVTNHLRLEQELGGYEAANEAERDIAAFYPELAKLLHCDEAEIAFMESATRAWQSALLSLDLQPGDQVLTADNEYASNYLSLLYLSRRHGVELITIPSGHDGLIDPQRIADSITAKTRAVALTHVASQRGDVQAITEVGEIAHENGLVFLVDACQSVGQIELNLKQLKCDFLCGTGRKYLRGPRGTGFLYANRETTQSLVPPAIDLHSASWASPSEFEIKAGAIRFESWERNVAGIIGLGKALKYANSLGMESIEARVRLLAKSLNRQLQSINGVEVHERSANLSGIVTLSRVNTEAGTLRENLQTLGVNTSVAKKQNARLDLDSVLDRDVLRASLHYYNSEEEVTRFVDLLAAS
jgi:selenocysteine lyase/cysteine desulfurase